MLVSWILYILDFHSSHFGLLFIMILFLTFSFLFKAMPWSSCARLQLVFWSVHIVTLQTIFFSGFSIFFFFYRHVPFVFFLFVYSLSHMVVLFTHISILSSTLPPSFLITYNQHTRSFKCKTFYMINYLVFLSIFLWSSFVQLKKGLEYLTRHTSLLLNSWLKVLFPIFSSSFWSFLSWFFIFFSLFIF